MRNLIEGNGLPANKDHKPGCVKVCGEMRRPECTKGGTVFVLLVKRWKNKQQTTLFFLVKGWECVTSATIWKGSEADRNPEESRGTESEVWHEDGRRREDLMPDEAWQILPRPTRSCAGLCSCHSMS